MPAVQSKETLLLDYDYTQQFSKRKIASNWDRYNESSDEEDNAQMSAADFEQILSAPKSIGEHFTFSSERNWIQQDDSSLNDANGAVDLFKLNIGQLKNGIGKLPFYIRQDFSKDLFTESELADMDFRVNYFDDKIVSKSETMNDSINFNILNALTTGKKPVSNDDPLEELLQRTTIANKSSEAPVVKATTSQAKSGPAVKQTNKQEKTANIQDWLDDILNESR